MYPLHTQFCFFHAFPRQNLMPNVLQTLLVVVCVYGYYHIIVSLCRFTEHMQMAHAQDAQALRNTFGGGGGGGG